MIKLQCLVQFWSEAISHSPGFVIFVPRHGEAIGGDIEMLGVRPSVRPSVRLSVRPSQSLLAR